MCSIAFVHAADTGFDLRGAAERMTRIQAHRGPDFQNVICRDGWAMGHARLRVMDPSPRSDQPFGRDGGSQWLAYNGEVYNFRELRHELSADVEFTTASDTEVVFEALRLWGEEAIERFEGMFALVFVDMDANEALLARDRIGIKPLHYAVSSNHLVVASEAKGVLASGLVERRLSKRGLHQIWRFNHHLGSQSSFEGVRVLAPGTISRVDLRENEMESRRYWRPRFNPTPSGTFEDRVEVLNDAFERSVVKQLRADRAVGVYLSGGIDSSGIASEVARQESNVETFTMCFPTADYSEGEQAAALASELGIANDQLVIDGCSLQEFADFIWTVEMPQWWTSDFALQKLAAHVAEQGHRVILAGEGPDEFLAGYDVYRGMRLRNSLRWLKPEKLARLAPLRSGVLSRVIPWLDFDSSVIERYLEVHRLSREPELQKRFGFHPENLLLWELFDSRHAALLTEEFERGREEADQFEIDFFEDEIKPFIDGLTELEANLYFEVSTRLPNWVLHMGDRVSAAHGLELRFPYLDKRVMETMLGLPENDRLRRLTEKYILRWVHRRRLPREVTRRTKQPLYSPVLDWIEGFFDDPEFDLYWSRESFASLGWFSFDAAEQVRAKLQTRDFDDQVDSMSAEWVFLLILSSQILHRRLGQMETPDG